MISPILDDATFALKSGLDMPGHTVAQCTHCVILSLILSPVLCLRLAGSRSVTASPQGFHIARMYVWRRPTLTSRVVLPGTALLPNLLCSILLFHPPLYEGALSLMPTWLWCHSEVVWSIKLVRIWNIQSKCKCKCK